MAGRLRFYALRGVLYLYNDDGASRRYSFGALYGNPRPRTDLLELFCHGQCSDYQLVLWAIFIWWCTGTLEP